MSHFDIEPTMTVHRFLLCFLLILPCIRAQASEPDAYHHVRRDDISATEKTMNFGIVYFAQWVGYYATQERIIAEHASYENWRKNIATPHFDKDHFNFNLFKHTAVGQYYYLFYRSRGYGVRSSMHWSALSSLAFEYTIETLTEAPSYQDLYQTPVFGSIVGMGFERLSLYLHSLETWPTTMLAYLFNPFTLLPDSSYRLSPHVTKHQGHNAIALSLGMDL